MGIVLKMCSNESEDGKYPTSNRLSTDEGQGDFYSVYPEYLTDVKILVCPSDATATGADVQELLDEIALGDPQQRYTDIGDFSLPNMKKLGMLYVLNRFYSYYYMGWATTSDNSLRGASWAPHLLKQDCGGGWDEPALCDLAKDFTLDNFGDPLSYYNNAFPDETPVFYEGSGGGPTVLALREGIERFFITNINNPAGSAKAQSDIFMVMDALIRSFGTVVFIAKLIP